jgi:hypothetical protein
MKNEGKAGCGCLIFILVICMIAVGILMHPFTLRMLGGQLRYEDKIFPSDVIIVPHFTEDRNGELYQEAFRQYQGGNARTILVEDDKIFGTSLLELVSRMARTRGLKEGAVKALQSEDDDRAGVARTKEQIERMGAKKVIMLVPEYSSKRFHLLYGSSGDEGKPVYLVHPVSVSYFTKDKWWKSSASRMLLIRELYAIGSFYADHFKYGEGKK